MVGSSVETRVVEWVALMVAATVASSVDEMGVRRAELMAALKAAMTVGMRAERLEEQKAVTRVERKVK